MKKWIFCGLWLLSMIVFFVGQSFAPSNYNQKLGNFFGISVNWGSFFAISVILGIGFFLAMIVYFIIPENSIPDEYIPDKNEKNAQNGKIRCACGILFTPEGGQTHCNYCGAKIAKIINKKLTTKKRNKKNKKNNFFLRLLLAGILSVVFLLITFPFLKRAENLPFEEQAKIGEANLWWVVFFYGFLTSIFVFISFWKKFFRITAILLIIFWFIGTSIVTAVNLDFFGKNNNVSHQQAIPTFTGQDIFDAVNNYRKENGLTELKLEQNICNNIAQRYLDIKSGLSENIAHKGFDEWYEKYLKEYGYFAAENYVWAQTPEEAIKAWDGSPSHRLSILDPKNKIGCSYATEGHAILILGYKGGNSGVSVNNSDTIVNCTIHSDCGGGSIQMKKSECDNMVCCLYDGKCGGPKFVNKSKCGDTITCCGLKDGSWTLMDNEQCNKVHDSYKSDTSNNTPQRNSNLNYYCYSNTYKYWYYTSSGEQCNADNARQATKESCLSAVKITVWDPCVKVCNNETATEVFEACLDKCSPPYKEAMSKCY